MLAVAAEMQESVGATADDAATLIDRAAAKLESLGEATVKREPKLLAQALADHINLLERRSTGGERVISTGYEDLDRALNGRPASGLVGHPGGSAWDGGKRVSR
ncbi:hypothetical protein L0Z13_11345 [Burkholderia multivorans]|uniref:hypothetical protein n=1 Tax=Burkholderia multivorans TaxID=87883 RepID=UPI00201916D8|nr:hypothetical protein [Burkholderia multivorans]UQO04944.1 hypothetical protein L0Z13_11345 [Burkholderia multivorans]